MTSSAGSATLGDTSWARILELAKFSTSLRIQDRAECGNGTELHGGGDTAHTFLMEGTIGVQKNIYWEGGTPHTQLGWGHRTTLKENNLGAGWVGGATAYLVSELEVPLLIWWVVPVYLIGCHCLSVKRDFRSHSGSHQSTAWIQNPSSSRVWQ